jgi:hypothetical protein
VHTISVSLLPAIRISLSLIRHISGGINASGQVPQPIGNFGLIDEDTPEDAYRKVSYETGEEWELVFSDEFNTDGRTFYPGDDPFWEAEDLHYWGTNNMEWYSPGLSHHPIGRNIIPHPVSVQIPLLQKTDIFLFSSIGSQVTIYPLKVG